MSWHVEKVKVKSALKLFLTLQTPKKTTISNLRENLKCKREEKSRAEKFVLWDSPHITTISMMIFFRIFHRRQGALVIHSLLWIPSFAYHSLCVLLDFSTHFTKKHKNATQLKRNWNYLKERWEFSSITFGILWCFLSRLEFDISEYLEKASLKFTFAVLLEMNKYKRATKKHNKKTTWQPAAAT